MGFLSGLGKALSIAAPFVAAPFTGGASLAGLAGTLGKIGNVAGAVGNVASTLGKQQESKAEGAIKQANTQQAQDRLALERYQQQQLAQDQAARMDLERKKYTGDEQQRNAKNALLSSLLKGGIAPTRVSVPGIANANISGGLMESLKNNPDALKTLATLGSQATAGLEAPPQF